ncbi:MAG: SUMF1/EgtB/PvdO family nonheme iron enzyme [Phycisphaerales bacterium]|nr:MAG: SUMF1/EgtB/PvdO family nonheme iron enzyme [Phycisphaerales bacterium]
MYWTDMGTDKIQRSNLDGSGVNDVLSPVLHMPGGIALDPAGGKMYWTDWEKRKIQRANLDGLGIEDLVTLGPISPWAIALDPTDGKMYWTAVGSDFEDGAIQRANLDGSNVETVITSGDTSHPGGIALDLAAGKMYWIDWSDPYSPRIRRANLDGSGIEDLITAGLNDPKYIALDLGAGKMYWTDGAGRKIQRANLDGSNLEDVLTTGSSCPLDIALDSSGGKLYWLDAHVIHRADFDGSDVEDLITLWGGVFESFGLALDLTSGQIYWTEANTDCTTGPARIRRASLDGSAIEDVIGTGIFSPLALALDLGAGKVYWTNGDPDDCEVGAMLRADLDGSNVEDVTTAPGVPQSVALDLVATKIYWHDGYDGIIRRANLDASDVEDLIDTGCEYSAIALDTAAGKIYWTEPCHYVVRRANLDGSDVEELVTGQTGLYSGQGIVLDVGAGKMYWSHNRYIQRASLDGSNIEVLVSLAADSGAPMGIALDVAAGKMYWTAHYSHPYAAKVQRANLDGSDIEDLVTLAFPSDLRGIALDLRVAADLDWDGDVDLDDYELWLTCLAGPGVPAVGGCQHGDLDRDSDVDLEDYALFQRGFTGPLPPPIVLDTVRIGNPGNADDTHDDGHGGVDYVYNIGKYEVTAGQYTVFLNAVAATDTYSLYSMYMDVDYYDQACNIVRTGSSGSYTYSVAPDWANRPVTFVSWGDAARFANWLHNGQPTGDQDLTTTEDGSYYLDGAMTNGELLLITREPDATWVIPTEDEWYKAAYHRNDGVTGNYWTFPTGTYSPPSNDLVDPDPGNNATYLSYDGSWYHTIGSPYYRTEVGAHENSDSPYGTYDQGGNVWEWNESIVDYGWPYPDGYRGIRGGAFDIPFLFLHAACRNRNNPSHDGDNLGFRVAEVPEPVVLSLDIKPGSCPNSFNRKSRGVLHTAVCGTETFDVTTIDIASVRLLRADGVGGEVAPHEGPPGPHSFFDDVATPYYGESCHELGADGIIDLQMHFENEVVTTVLDLDALAPGAVVELLINGSLLDGTPFTTEGDSIRLVPPGGPPGLVAIRSTVPDVWIDAYPLDLQLDDGGFADFERSYPQSTVVTYIAPRMADGVRFAYWQIDGQPQARGQTAVSFEVVGEVTEADAVFRNPTLEGVQGTPVEPIEMQPIGSMMQPQGR